MLLDLVIMLMLLTLLLLETNNFYGCGRIRVVSPVGRFAGSFRPGSFRPCFSGGSIRPY